MTTSQPDSEDLAQPVRRIQEETDHVREIHPLVMDYNNTNTVTNFRPVPVPAGMEVEDPSLDEVEDPKDSSAVEPADSSDDESQMENQEPVTQSSEVPVVTVVPTVAKASTRPKGSSSGTQTS